MELKWGTAPNVLTDLCSSNRTFMELKYLRVSYVSSKLMVF